MCKRDGENYYDTQDDHIPEDAMLRASARFMAGPRIAKDMHQGAPVGSVVFAMPMTGDIAEALAISVRQTGLIVGMKPQDPEILEKYRSGEYTGFSIGGRRVIDREV